ncbi:hypothetical protein DSO57_1011768 [Entomophthora muscae]|uniref:Uncharacterized protein n=1 Tax=Entomophthora muscae TaxID=34485 RepID=A0ACC2SV17_9FUNG|nr:hypothetical protein DSO57_1011768 [Entomophthora muscae]
MNWLSHAYMIRSENKAIRYPEKGGADVWDSKQPPSYLDAANGSILDLMWAPTKASG